MSATTTTHSAAIATVSLPTLIAGKGFNNETPLINFFGFRPNPGGDSFDWRIKYAGNTSATSHSEGAAAPSSGNLSIAAPTIAWTPYHAAVTITGSLQAAVRGGHYDAISAELQELTAALLKDVESDFATALAGYVNDDTSFAGLTRSATGTASYVKDASSADLSNSMMHDVFDNLKSPTYGVVSLADYVWVMSEVQARKLANVADDSLGANINLSLESGNIDVGRVSKLRSFEGIPILVAPTFSDTVILLVKKSDVFMTEAAPLTIDPLGLAGDYETLYARWKGVGVCLNPGQSARIENLAS